MKYSKPGKKELKKYYEELSDKEVQDKLDSAINMLLRRDIRKNNKDDSKKNEDKDSYDKFSFTNSKGRRKYLPKISLYSKSIEQWLSYSTLYYGECYVYQEFIKIGKNTSEQVSDGKDSETQSEDSNSLDLNDTLVNNEDLYSEHGNINEGDTKSSELGDDEGNNNEVKDYWLYHFLNKENKEKFLTMKITGNVKKYMKHDFSEKAETAQLYSLAFIMELSKDKNNYKGTLWSSVYFKFVEAEEDK